MCFLLLMRNPASGHHIREIVYEKSLLNHGRKAVGYVSLDEYIESQVIRQNDFIILQFY